MEHYIPANLEECFLELKRMMPKHDLEFFKNAEELTAPVLDLLHIRIANMWDLWARSRLARYFESKGVSNPEDMVYILLRSFHRHLNGKEIQLEKQIEDIGMFARIWFDGKEARIVKMYRFVCAECKKEHNVPLS